MRTRIGWLGLVVVGLVIGSVVSNGAVRADATPPVTKHHHHHHGIHGKITAVDSTSITIKVHHHHKKAEPAVAPESKTFQISSTTKVVRVTETGKTASSVSELKVGEHVSIHEHEGTVTEIVIHHHRHHHKKVAA